MDYVADPSTYDFQEVGRLSMAAQNGETSFVEAYAHW